jgi:hypothetical protein
MPMLAQGPPDNNRMPIAMQKMHHHGSKTACICLNIRLIAVCGGFRRLQKQLKSTFLVRVNLHKLQIAAKFTKQRADTHP